MWDFDVSKPICAKLLHRWMQRSAVANPLLSLYSTNPYSETGTLQEQVFLRRSGDNEPLSTAECSKRDEFFLSARSAKVPADQNRGPRRTDRATLALFGAQQTSKHITPLLNVVPLFQSNRTLCCFSSYESQ